MDNEDGLFGDIDSFTQQYTRELPLDAQTTVIASESIVLSHQRNIPLDDTIFPIFEP
jgi:hypothetical protein